MSFQFDALTLVGDTVQCLRNVATKGSGSHFRHECIMYVQYVMSKPELRPGHTRGGATRDILLHDPGRYKSQASGHVGTSAVNASR